MQAYDIDWFAKCESYYLHFASNGSELPLDLENDNLFEMQNQVAQIIEKGEPRINEQHLHRLLENGRLEVTTTERYLASFKIFASKGFYSFDYDQEEKIYILVAAPEEGLQNMNFDEIHLPLLDGDKEWEIGCIAQIRALNK